jgi:hypothetical protein
MLFSLPAYAIDLNGAWADDVAMCNKIFVKKNDRLTVASDSDHYGSGVIFEGNKIRGKIATCNIKTRKEEADVLHLIAVCSDDVALSTVQFSIKIENDNKITRVYPGVPELSVSYNRCP